jgi:uncharacterized protein
MTSVIETIQHGGGANRSSSRPTPSPGRSPGPWLGCLALLVVVVLVVGGAVAALAILVRPIDWGAGAGSIDASTTCRSSSDELIRDAVAGDVAAVRAAMRGRTDLNAVDGDGNTPLACAIAGGSAAVVRSLLAAGASPNVPGSENDPCLSFVELSGATRSAANCRLPIARAVSAGRADLVVLLLAHGADPDAALLEASVTDDVRLGRVALNHGAEPNGGGGTTPLVYDAAFANDAFVRLLLDHGANPDLGGPADVAQVLDALGRLDSGTTAGDAALRRLVCSVDGTAPNLQPLVVAAAVGDPVAIRALLAHHADPNAIAGFDPPVSALTVAQVAHQDAAASALRAGGATRRTPVRTTTTAQRFGC